MGFRSLEYAKLFTALERLEFMAEGINNFEKRVAAVAPIETLKWGVISALAGEHCFLSEEGRALQVNLLTEAHNDQLEEAKALLRTYEDLAEALPEHLTEAIATTKRNAAAMRDVILRYEHATP